MSEIDWSQFQDCTRVRLTFEGLWRTNGSESSFLPDGANRHCAIFLPGWVGCATSAAAIGVEAITTFDVGDPEPPGDVIGLTDYTAPDNECDGYEWGRTHRAGEGGQHSEWKGYKNGGKVYLDWPELLRRWGPVTVSMYDDPRAQDDS